MNKLEQRGVSEHVTRLEEMIREHLVYHERCDLPANQLRATSKAVHDSVWAKVVHDIRGEWIGDIVRFTRLAK